MAKVSFFLVVFFLCLLSQKQRQSVAASGDPKATPLLAFSFPSSSDNISAIGLQQGGGGGGGGGSVSRNSNASISINSGIVLYRHRIHSINGFSTSFSFSFSFSNANANPNAAFTFFLTLATVSLDLLHGPPPSILSLSFIPDTIHNRLCIRVAGFVDAPLAHQDHYFLLNNNNSSKLHAWIDYNYDYDHDAALINMNHRLEVRLTRSNTTNTAPAPAKPHSPILSYPLDLSNVLSKETMLVGFASTDNCTLYQWMFVAPHGAPYLLHSQPLDPNKFPARPAQDPLPRHRLIKSHLWAPVLALIFAAACGAMLTFFAIFVWFSVCAHRPVAPVEYPVHPVDVVYEKIMLVGLKHSVHNK